MLDFPRLQITIALGIWVVAYLTMRLIGGIESSTWIFFTIACLLYQGYWIWPNTRIHTKEVLSFRKQLHTTAPTLKILTSNVLMDNRDSSRLLALVIEHKPDVLATLETDSWWQDQLDTLEGYPHRIACPLDNLYGMHIYSRLPLHDTQTEFLVSPDIPSMSARIELPDRSLVRLHVVHPTPPVPGENPRSIERDVELLILAKTLQDCKERIVVTGDLNDVAWSASTRLFRRVSGLLDPRTGRGMFNTFHADYWIARWPLDHVFVSNHFRLVDISRLGHIGSDHFPMLVELGIEQSLELDNHPAIDDADAYDIEETLNTKVGKQASAPSMR